jgi:hypothetical protein
LKWEKRRKTNTKGPSFFFWEKKMQESKNKGNEEKFLDSHQTPPAPYPPFLYPK